MLTSRSLHILHSRETLCQALAVRSSLLGKGGQEGIWGWEGMQTPFPTSYLTLYTRIP